MEVNAKVKNFESLKTEGISIIFYGHGVDGNEFNLEIPYSQDGHIEVGDAEDI